MTRYVLFLLLALLILAGGSLSQAQVPAATFEPGDCPFPLLNPDVPVDCGTLIVPERWEDPEGPTIELAVAVLRYTGGDRRPDPVLYLEGGPGGSALAGVDGWYEYPATTRRDLILVDQRGTGFSLPTLNCPEIDEEFDSEDPYIVENLCYDRLREEGVNLEAFTTVQSSGDIAALGPALGYTEVNLFGVSYGTRLGMEVVENYPEGIRSLVIDGVYPQNVDAYIEGAANTQSVFDGLFAACRADPGCNRAYPDLEERFYAKLDELTANPVDAFWAGAEVEGLDGVTILDTFFGDLYSSSLIPYLPAAMEAVIDGDWELAEDIRAGVYMPVGDYGDYGDYGADMPEFADLGDSQVEDLWRVFLGASSFADAREQVEAMTDEEYEENLLWLEDEYNFMRYMGYGDLQLFYNDLDRMSAEEQEALYAEYEWVTYGADSDSEGYFNNVDCNDEVPFYTYEELEAFIETLNLRTVVIESALMGGGGMFDTCDIWQVERAPASENAPISSPVQTLILSGALDPITPPVWGDVAQAGLPNSWHYVFPIMGHAVVGSDDCPTQIFAEFLDDPFSEPNAACIANMNTSFEIVP
jgi:pimeloyl-ACP methyl ester carboxylesterase